MQQSPTAVLLAGYVAASIRGWTPPIIMYGLLGAMVTALAIGLVLVTMRSLLLRAIALSTEMEQVV